MSCNLNKEPFLAAITEFIGLLVVVLSVGTNIIVGITKWLKLV